MANCADCKHGIFCETWGEYKCLAKSIRPRNTVDIICTDYIYSYDEQEKCQCTACSERYSDDE